VGEDEDKAPDTVPVPTPPFGGAGVTPRNSMEGGRSPPKRRKPVASRFRSVDAILDDIEAKGGAVVPELVMIVLRSYRALEATNQAQKRLIRKLGDEIVELKKKRGTK
jgi:hypothetical protein